MDPTRLRRELSAALVEFAWNEWAQMGVFADPRRKAGWAQDPEALILFTLEIGRSEARLLDEVLDWVLANENLLSVRRLRALAQDDEDRRLTDAALAWVSRHRPRTRLHAAASTKQSDPAPLFRRGGPIRNPDPAFAAAGYQRSLLVPSRKSQPPDLLAPINLGFLVYFFLGVSVRSEVIRLLLTTDGPRVTANALAQSAGYSKRNVHEALDGLTSAKVVSTVTAGSEQRYAAQHDAWIGLLRPADERFPDHRDWPQLLGALRRIVRWLHRPEIDELSDYILASELRDLLDELRAPLAHASIPVPSTPGLDAARQDLADTIDVVLARLGIAPLGQ